MHLPAEYPLNGLKWNPESVTVIFWRVHKWIGKSWFSNLKKAACEHWWGPPVPSPSKTFKRLWDSRKAEKRQICWMSRLESIRLEKQFTIWPFVAVQVYSLPDFALSAAVFSDFLARLSIRSPLTPQSSCSSSLGEGLFHATESPRLIVPQAHCRAHLMPFLHAPLQFPQLHGLSWCKGSCSVLSQGSFTWLWAQHPNQQLSLLLPSFNKGTTHSTGVTQTFVVLLPRDLASPETVFAVEMDQEEQPWLFAFYSYTGFVVHWEPDFFRLSGFSLSIYKSNERSLSLLWLANLLILFLTICLCFRINHLLLWGLVGSTYSTMDELQDVQLTEIKPLLNDKVMLWLYSNWLCVWQGALIARISLHLEVP